MSLEVIYSQSLLPKNISEMVKMFLPFIKFIILQLVLLQITKHFRIMVACHRLPMLTLIILNNVQE